MEFFDTDVNTFIKPSELLTPALRPIDTVFRGYRMRSRLEARWAKFFQELGIKWEYEMEGYHCDKEKYLPDFWLPEQKAFIEIKGQMPTDAEIRKMSAFRKALISSSGWCKQYHIIIGRPYMEWDDDKNNYEKEYDIYDIYESKLTKWSDLYFMRCLQCDRVIIAHFSMGYGSNENIYHCEWCDITDRNTDGIPDLVTFHKGDLLTNKYMPMNGGLADAYRKAMQARFEHGEKG